MKYLYLDYKDGLDGIERRGVKEPLEYSKSPYERIAEKALEMNEDLRKTCLNNPSVSFKDHCLVKINDGYWQSRQGSYIRFKQLTLRLK